MKDLKLDRQRPWEGLGRDPREDRWEDDDDRDEDVDPGVCSLSILSRSPTYAFAVQNDAQFLDIVKARRVGDEDK